MHKAERITRVHNTLTEEQLFDRLPEIATIFDDDLRKQTITAFLDGCPDHFWEKPTSSTGKYHNTDENGVAGNWLHTKRVFITYLSLSRSYLEQGLITDYERDCGKSAVLLHDMLKYGWPSEQNDHTVNNHDVISAAVAEHIGGLPNEVSEAIDSHNGAWAEGSNPETWLQQCVHTADYVASKPALGSVSVWNPHQTIIDECGDVPTIDDETFEGML